VAQAPRSAHRSAVAAAASRSRCCSSWSSTSRSGPRSDVPWRRPTGSRSAARAWLGASPPADPDDHGGERAERAERRARGQLDAPPDRFRPGDAVVDLLAAIPSVTLAVRSAGTRPDPLRGALPLRVGERIVRAVPAVLAARASGAAPPHARRRARHHRAPRPVVACLRHEPVGTSFGRRGYGIRERDARVRCDRDGRDGAPRPESRRRTRRHPRARSELDAHTAESSERVVVMDAPRPAPGASSRDRSRAGAVGAFGGCGPGARFGWLRA